MTCTVIATNLEITTVFTQAHGELSLLDNLLLLHHIIDRLKSVQIHPGSLTGESQDPISLLTVKVLGLCVDTPKRVLKHIDAGTEILAEVQRVLHYVAFIAGTLGIGLVEATASALYAATVDFRAVVEGELVRHGCLVQAVDMTAAGSFRAVVAAWDGCHR